MKAIGYSLEGLDYVYEESSKKLKRRFTLSYVITTLNEMTGPESFK